MNVSVKSYACVTVTEQLAESFRIETVFNTNSRIGMSIVEYLDDLERKVGQAIDRQVEKWKSTDREYLIAVEKGDIQQAARLENCLVYMAREVIFECMVYI